MVAIEVRYGVQANKPTQMYGNQMNPLLMHKHQIIQLTNMKHKTSVVFYLTERQDNLCNSLDMLKITLADLISNKTMSSISVKEAQGHITLGQFTAWLVIRGLFKTVPVSGMWKCLKIKVLQLTYICQLKKLERAR